MPFFVCNAAFSKKWMVLRKRKDDMNRNPVFLQVRKLVYSALCLAIALVLPFLTGQIPEIGAMLCPMHFPVLLCGFVCGWPWGLAVGVISPLLRSFMFSMPPMFPVAVAMAVEMGVFGVVSGALYRTLPKTKWRVYPALLIAMVLGRIAWGGVQFLLAGLQGTVFTPELFMAGAVFGAIPGIVLQLLLIPVLVIALDQGKLVLNH